MHFSAELELEDWVVVIIICMYSIDKRCPQWKAKEFEEGISLCFCGHCSHLYLSACIACFEGLWPTSIAGSGLEEKLSYRSVGIVTGWSGHSQHFSCAVLRKAGSGLGTRICWSEVETVISLYVRKWLLSADNNLVWWATCRPLFLDWLTKMITKNQIAL